MGFQRLIPEYLTSRNKPGQHFATRCVYKSMAKSVAPLFVPATGGLDVDAIPSEITTRIILNSSKSSILAQAINISAKGVR